MKAKDLGDLITQAEAARLRGVTPVAIVDLIRRGRLQTVEIAGRRLLRRQDVINFREKAGGRPRNRKPDGE
jgi:hypothetical protein